MRFGEKLRRARRRAGLSQEEVADMFDYTQSAISQWESGREKPRPAIQEWVVNTLKSRERKHDDN